MDERYLETAITLSRLYGIAETLHPWDFLENGKFLRIIKAWTEEYLNSGEQNIVKFFESKVIE